MEQTLWWIMSIVGPAVLLIVLIWLALRRGRSQRGTREDQITERATHDEYVDEERRRREGTDGL